MKTKDLFKLLISAILLLVVTLFSFSCCGEEPDVFAPSVPSGLKVVSASTTTINISWTASTDNVGVVGYKVYRDGVQAGTVTSTSFADKNLMPNSEYTYTVSAFDAVGNVSKLSSPLVAKTEDDCPTCSKWMTEINFTPPAGVGIIEAGQSKSAGSLLVKNISTSSHTANLTLSFPDAVALAVDSLSYTLNGEVVKQKLSNNSVTLNQISVPANSTVEIKLSYKIKEVIPAGITDGTQIGLALTATTTDEVGVTEPGNRVFPSINLDKLKVLTAKIDISKSYEASARVEDKVLFGNSVAKAFVLEVATPGTVRLEVVGEMSDGSSPVKYFWINNKDDEDFYTSVSTLNPIHPKTSFGSTGSIEVNLKAGTNVIAFKTNPYSGKIANNSKVGLRVVGNDFVLENGSYTANSSAANVAARVKVWASWMYNFWIPAKTIGTDFAFSDWRLTPLDENGNYDGNSYPKIENMAVDTRYWTTNYPSLIFTKTADTPLGFGEDFKMLGVIFGNNINEQGFGTIFAKDLANNIVKYENSIIYFSGPAIQTVGNHNYAGMETRVNLYNTGGQEIKTVVRGFDPYPKGWKFTGNPEIELWTHAEQSASVRVQ